MVKLPILSPMATIALCQISGNAVQCSTEQQVSNRRWNSPAVDGFLVCCGPVQRVTPRPDVAELELVVW